MLVNAEVGMLFIAMHGKPQRLRVNGTATVNREDPLLARSVGAQFIVRVSARAISDHAVDRCFDLLAAIGLRST